MISARIGYRPNAVFASRFNDRDTGDTVNFNMDRVHGRCRSPGFIPCQNRVGKRDGACVEIPVEAPEGQKRKSYGDQNDGEAGRRSNLFPAFGHISSVYSIKNPALRERLGNLTAKAWNVTKRSFVLRSRTFIY